MMNWAAPYNRLFILLDRQGPTYHGGPAFIRMAQQIDQDIPNYRQLLDQRANQGKSSSRRDFYWDIFKAFNDEQKLRFFRIFITELELHAKEEVDGIRALVFGGGFAVPVAVVPLDLWNSEKLNNSLKDIDHAIDAQQFNRAVTLAYTCLEGLYKSYVRKHVGVKADLTDLISCAVWSRMTLRKSSRPADRFQWKSSTRFRHSPMRWRIRAIASASLILLTTRRCGLQYSQETLPTL